jgi:hypothetical protein
MGGRVVFICSFKKRYHSYIQHWVGSITASWHSFILPPRCTINQFLGFSSLLARGYVLGREEAISRCWTLWPGSGSKAIDTTCQITTLLVRLSRGKPCSSFRDPVVVGLRRTRHGWSSEQWRCHITTLYSCTFRFDKVTGFSNVMASNGHRVHLTFLGTVPSIRTF